MVSAFAARQRLVLGQVKVDDKSNEITAIPRLLAMMEIEGAIVTIDAMGWGLRNPHLLLIGILITPHSAHRQTPCLTN